MTDELEPAPPLSWMMHPATALPARTIAPMNGRAALQFMPGRLTGRG